MNGMEITKSTVASNIGNAEEEDEEDFIEMELISSPQPKEFEFQKMSSLTSTHKQTTTSSADELFFNGKLLPLHRSAAAFFPCSGSAPCTTTTTAATTPLTISPSEFCRPSCDLKPDDDFFFFQWSSTQITTFINPATKKPWLKKLKLINTKHSSILAQKLKSSRAYLKSIFSKQEDKPTSSKAEKKLISISRLDFYHPRMKNAETGDGVNVQRRSFSGAMKRHYYPSSSSSSSASSSFNSSGVNESEFLRRSSSATEIEVSIDAAIAHCKNSLQISLG